MNRRLYRSPDDRVLAGVAGGMAETYDLDPAVARVVWALLILLTGGVFLILYIVMALVVPLRPSDQPFAYDETRGWEAGPPNWPAATGAAAAGAPAGTDSTTTGFVAGDAPPAGPPPGAYGRGRPPRPGSSDNNGPVIFGAILILIGALFLIRQFVDIDFGRLWPIAVIVIGLVLIAGALGRGRQRA